MGADGSPRTPYQFWLVQRSPASYPVSVLADQELALLVPRISSGPFCLHDPRTPYQFWPWRASSCLVPRISSGRVSVKQLI
jgi:hypothetical protein